MKRWPILAALLPFSALLVVSIWLLTRPAPGPTTFSSPERPVPERQIATLEGQPFSFPSLKGRPYLVNFWAPWCTPCRAEHPLLLQMKGEGVAILGVLHFSSGDKADPPAAVERGKVHLAREGNPFESVAVDPTGDVSLDFGITGVPETFLVNAQGTIIKTMRGPVVDQATAQDFITAYRAELAKGAPSSQ